MVGECWALWPVVLGGLCGAGRGGMGGGASPRDWHVVDVALALLHVDCSVLLKK